MKVALGFFVASVASHVLGSVFGGPYERLPDDVRSGFEQRLDAALNHQLDGLSDADQQARVEALIEAGLPRLQDATLVKHMGLQSLAIDKAAVATCAAYARTDFAGKKPSADVSTKLISGFDDASMRQWLEINVEAIEAEAGKSPAARTVTSADVDSALTSVFQGLPATDRASVQSLGSGATVPDAAACSVERSINRAAAALTAADLALVARYIVSP